jgi:hypothetical protein
MITSYPRTIMVKELLEGLEFDIDDYEKWIFNSVLQISSDMEKNNKNLLGMRKQFISGGVYQEEQPEYDGYF